MTWPRRLKRAFSIDILTSVDCGGAVKVIASIEDPVVIKKFLEHPDRRAETAALSFSPVARARIYVGTAALERTLQRIAPKGTSKVLASPITS